MPQVCEVLEALLPSETADVPAAKLIETFSALPAEESGDAARCVKILRAFEKASTLQLPTTPGLHLWIGRSWTAYQERDDNDFYAFAVLVNGETRAMTQGLLCDTDDEILLVQSLIDQLAAGEFALVGTRYEPYMVELKMAILNKMHDHLVPIEKTSGASLKLEPKGAPKVFVRQDGRRVLLAEPSVSGGWYSELWPVDLSGTVID